MLSREEILAKRDLPPVPVRVPEWGPGVYVRTLSGEQREEYESALDKRRDAKGMLSFGTYRAMQVVYGVCNAEGVLVFTEADIPQIIKQPVKTLMKISTKFSSVNGLTEADVEALEKNSDTDGTASGGSVSPAS